MTTFVRGAAIGAAMAMLGASVGAQSTGGEPFRPVQGSGVAKKFVSRMSTDSSPITVIVMLAGEPVALAQQRAGRKLGQGERDAIIAARRVEHDALQPQLERLGGRVQAHLHSALNGIKLTIAKNRLDQLRKLAGVVDVKLVGQYERLNVNAVPLVAAPQAWTTVGNFRGEGVKIVVIDTGIDYTHANFGGPGTVAAYNTAFSTNTQPADPQMFGPGAPKVKGGTDLVGDAYTGRNTPVPDPNPLDCPFNSGSVGHGSHAAGTATGLGVTAGGQTYSGPYTSAAYTPGAFSIGPGVAPKADLYSVRVFGCSGSTNVVAEAIDWSVAHGMDVISMSLGSNYGNIGNGDAGSLAENTAVANAAAAGILVVAASGNAGPTPYITSAPAVFEGAISVAATDALAAVPTATLTLTGGASITAIDANGATFPSGSAYDIRVLRNADGTVSLGCNPNEYDPAVTGVNLAGKIIVTARGTCARVFRAGAAQHFGAAAAVMINNANSLPPYEGPISGGASDPNAGNIYEPVTIPFFGVSLADATTLSGPIGGPAPAQALAVNAGLLANAGFEKIASFSSAGPRIGDSALRPGVTAPGVSVVSTASGTGNSFSILSGTSMATPGVAGVAALVKQAHPGWSQPDMRAAVVQTAAPAMMKDLLQRNEGAGLVQALAAATTQAVVRMPDESVSFGYADLLTDFNATKTVTVHNSATKAVTFNITVSKTSGPAGVTVSTPASVSVGANGDATFPVTLTVPAAGMGTGTAFTDVSGYIQLTPSNSRLNGNVKLSVPYYLVAHSRSTLDASITNGSTLNFTNVGGTVSGTPVFYTWGLHQPTPQGITQADVRAVGARLSGSNVVFGINTHNRTSTTLAFQEIDICLDTSGNPGFTPSKVLIGINRSAITGNSADASSYVTALFPTDANCNIIGSGSQLFLQTQPTDNSTFQITVGRGGSGTTGLGLTSSQPRFKYSVNYFGTDGIGAAMPGIGTFNAFAPAITFSGAPTVAPNGTGTATFAVGAEIVNTPALGLMVVTPDNTSGAAQSLLFTVP